MTTHVGTQDVRPQSSSSSRRERQRTRSPFAKPLLPPSSVLPASLRSRLTLCLCVFRTSRRSDTMRDYLHLLGTPEAIIQAQVTTLPFISCTNKCRAHSFLDGMGGVHVNSIRQRRIQRRSDTYKNNPSHFGVQIR